LLPQVLHGQGDGSDAHEGRVQARLHGARHQDHHGEPLRVQEVRPAGDGAGAGKTRGDDAEEKG
jgi:hypothetical protein